MQAEKEKNSRTRGEDGANNIDKIQDEDEVGYKECNSSMAQAKNDNIDCPYEDCQKKLKGKSSFLKHLCLIHHRNELESRIIKMKSGKFKCPKTSVISILRTKDSSFLTMASDIMSSVSS